jgi:signal transduction histidine kinase
MLGLGGIFLVRFYFLANVLLLGMVQPAYVTTQAAALLGANVAIGLSLVRGGFVDAHLSLSRQVLYRSVIVGTAGAYLFAVGTLSWLLNHFGIPEQLFWTTLVVFVSGLVMAAVLLSEDVRWRVARFLGRHIYRSKYDHRDQWATKGALYLTAGRAGRFDLVSAIGLGRLPAQLTPSPSLLARLDDRRGQAVVCSGEAGAGEGRADDGVFADVALLVPLRWQGGLVGLMLVGPERTGARYLAEDLEFLSTVAEQGAVAIVTSRLSEDLARSREFEAFHRLTSFVIHDVKNAVSALSLLSRNAATNFEDPEFRHDAIKTLVKTVGRMNGLLGRLSSASEVAHDTFVRCDLAALLRQAAVQVTNGRAVYLVDKTIPVPAVLGDPAALERVLENVLKNALEAMDGNGQLTVRTEVRGDEVASTVIDTGRGMSADFVRGSLFVPFRSTKDGGWGVGLFQAKEIIEAHGGHIEVESEEGKGSSFTILLPIAVPTTLSVGTPRLVQQR